jgi:hypothetical protein
MGAAAAGAPVRDRRRGSGVVRREDTGVGVVEAPAVGAGAPVAGTQGHGLRIHRRRRAAARAAQQGSQVPDHAARLPRRSAKGDAAVPPDHEGARCVFYFSLLSSFSFTFFLAASPQF